MLTRTGFEVNTDTALIDPDWEDFAEAHERRYGLAIAYMKSAVKGASYSNKVMRLIVSKRGFYAQSRNFPAAFYGDTGEMACELVSEEAALAAVWEAVALYRASEAQSLTCIYSEITTDVFFGYRAQGEHYELGELQNTLPLHLRVMVDAREPSDLLEHPKGVFIYQRTRTGEHLLLRAPGRRQPFPLLDGFGE